MNNYQTRSLLCILLCLGASGRALAQSIIVGQENESIRTITTAVPFLNITPDARAGGMGDAGAATEPDNFSNYWNVSKLAFKKEQYGLGVSYTPWLANLGVNDIFLAYVSGYMKLRQEDAIGVSMRYFSLGNIQFTNENGTEIGQFSPNEFTFDASYSRALSPDFSVGLAGRFIHSDLTGGVSNSAGTDAKPASTAAIDLTSYYQKDILIGPSLGQIAFGGAITNFGPKVSYSNNDQRDFIPTNLRLGGRFTYEIDPYNKISLNLDGNKLLVPSPIVVENVGELDSLDQPNYSLLRGVFGSFSDAEGGFSEEMQEIMVSIGVEYWYSNIIALRGGYFHEHANKGNRKFFTAGLGLRYQKLGFDFSYLIATNPNNPLRNTLRFSISFDFGEEFGDGKGDSVTDEG